MCFPSSTLHTMDLDIQVPPSYPPGCKVVFVGEAPGKEEVDAKEGWIGQAGRCLQRACGVAKIPWENAGKSNVVKRRPFNDSNDFDRGFYETIEEPIYTKTGKLSKKTKRIKQPTVEYHEWLVELERELQAQSPNLVVACGNEALAAITGHKGITNYRGSVLESRWKRENDGVSIKVLATEHPSYIIQGNTERFWILAHDLKKAKREMEFPEIRREKWESYPDPMHQVERVTYALGLLRCNPSWKWTLDVETRAGTLACFAVGYRSSSGVVISFCVPIQTASGAYWSPEEELQVWEALRATAKANPNLSNQNIEYDIYYLLRYGVEPSGVYMDTMLAHSVLYPEFPKGLDFLCSFYLEDVVYYKGEGRDWKAGDRDIDLWGYCCKDAGFTLRVVEKIDLQLQERGLWEFYHGKLMSESKL